MFTIIACVNKKGVIGNNGELLYHIKNDLSNFKAMTVGNVVIMGRKTFESLPNKKPLKNRINIIITSNKAYGIEESENTFIVNSIEDAVELCSTLYDEKELFVIGGGEIYKAFTEKGLVSEMRLTIVDDEKEGETVFPQYDENEWKTYYESLPQSDGENTFIYKILKKSE